MVMVGVPRVTVPRISTVSRKASQVDEETGTIRRLSFGSRGARFKVKYGT